MDYGDFFHETWKVFSKYPVIHMRDFDGKKVRLCLVSVFGLYALAYSAITYCKSISLSC
jgi:hypothetical protein